jgi:predicted amidophosphoribosyltransferase
LVNRYKFDNARSAYVPLGDLLLATLPDLPANTVIVPIPTIRTHIRQRGYDHTLLLAQYVAKKRGLAVSRPLRRQTATVQRGADRKQRLAQAKAAFVVDTGLSSDVPYLLIDDVVTTSATMLYGAKALRQAGATTIWAAAIVRQPFDENSKQQR